MAHLSRRLVSVAMSHQVMGSEAVAESVSRYFHTGLLHHLLAAADKKPLTKEQSAKVIEAAIRKAAKKPTGELTKADLWKLTHLSLHNNQLTDVKGLKNLTQLESLDLNGNPLTSVKGLENLPNLKWLYLNDNNLTSVEGLEKLTQLEVLWLLDNQLTDVAGLENLTQLKDLDLSKNQLTSVKGLCGLHG